MTMRVCLYARLSNDDDPAQNSLQNQQEICRTFAEKKDWTIVGSSTDDNISGMNFSRRGLDTLTAAVQAKQIDAVLVKDLSRLGRHRTQTALFIDYLREHQVRVISVTEGVDTFDPLLERQPPCGIRLPGLPPERERLLQLSPDP